MNQRKIWQDRIRPRPQEKREEGGNIKGSSSEGDRKEAAVPGDFYRGRLKREQGKDSLSQRMRRSQRIRTDGQS